MAKKVTKKGNSKGTTDKRFDVNKYKDIWDDRDESENKPIPPDPVTKNSNA